jgi:hypothetical protein
MSKASHLLLLAMTSISLPVAAAPSHSFDRASTVNSFTAEQEAGARQAATRAGFTSGTVLFAQAGNFFFNASKGGRSYGLTVTPDGHVYASMPTD